MLFALLAGPLPPLIDEDGSVIFRYRGEAKEVYLAGSFNDWNPTADPMKKVEDNLWIIKKSLTPGKYEYKFVIDGEWLPGPNIPLVLAYDESGRVVIKRERPSNTLSNWWAVLTGRIWTDTSAGMSNGTAVFGGDFYSFVDFGFDFKRGIGAGFRIGATPSSLFVDEARISFKRGNRYMLFYNFRGVFDYTSLFSQPSYGVLTDLYRPYFPLASWRFMEDRPWGAGEGLYGALASSEKYLFGIYSSGSGTPGGILAGFFPFEVASFGSVSLSFSPRLLAVASPSSDAGIQTSGGWAEYPEGNPYGVWYHFDEIRALPEATVVLLPFLDASFGSFSFGASPLYEETWGPSLYLHADMSNGKEPGGPGYDHPVDITFEEPEKYHRKHLGGIVSLGLDRGNLKVSFQGHLSSGSWMMDNITYSSLFIGADLWAGLRPVLPAVYLSVKSLSLDDYAVPSTVVFSLKIPELTFKKFGVGLYSRQVLNSGEKISGFDSLDDLKVFYRGFKKLEFALGLRLWRSSYSKPEGSFSYTWFSPYAYASYRAGTFSFTLYSGSLNDDPWGVPRWIFGVYEKNYSGDLWNWFMDPEGRYEICSNAQFSFSMGVRVDASF